MHMADATEERNMRSQSMVGVSGKGDLIQKQSGSSVLRAAKRRKGLA